MLRRALRCAAAWTKQSSGRTTFFAAMVLLTSCAGIAGAQDVSSQLVVWIVSPASGPAFRGRMNTAGQLPTEVQSQTAGSFGQAAGSVGQTAGSAGQTAGNFGQIAGSVGQNAGDAGQAAGSFGRAAGAVGQNAGDAGQTAGNFGVSTTDLPAAAAAANRLNLNGLRPKRTQEWEAFVDRVERGQTETQIRFVDVFANTLQASVDAVAGTDDAPDVLVGRPLPAAWHWRETEDDSSRQRVGPALVWAPAWLLQTENDSRPASRWTPEAVVVTSGRNQIAAQQFVAWLNGVDWNWAAKLFWASMPAEETLTTEAGDKDTDDVKASRAAAQALRDLLLGRSIDIADPEMARFSASRFAGMQLRGVRPDWAEHVQFRTGTTSSVIRNGLAVVALRSVIDGPKAFGAVNALAVLRRDENGNWLVLQITPSLQAAEQEIARHLLMDAGARQTTIHLTEGTTVLGISQASPPDGDSRAGVPELWWDNNGGATLQVVEWQRDYDGEWSISNLYFVPDSESRVRTRTTGRFAAARAKYRWRVWSVGLNGALVLSPWRTFSVVGP